MNRTRIIRFVAAATTFLPFLDARPSAGQEVASPEERVEQLGEAFAVHADGYDWEAEIPNLQRAIDNIFQANGWTQESDTFARRVAHDVLSIPPWKPMKRVDRMCEYVAARYGLDAQRTMRFKTRFLVEMGTFIGRNGPALFAHVHEMFEVRTSGQPFTSEEVARWAKAFEPFRAESDATKERMLAELDKLIFPDRRETFSRDIEAFRKRDEHFNGLLDRWAEGKWEPSDWGLQDDPIHVRAPGSERPKGAVAGQDPDLPSRWLPHEPATWIAYVRDFEQRYALDAGQKTAAESVHAELVERAAGYITPRREELAAVAGHERATHELYGPVRELFEELRSRLLAIPTSGQQRPNTP